MKSVDLKIFFPILIVLALVGIYFVLKNSALAGLFIDVDADSSNLIGIILALALVTTIPRIIYTFRPSSLNDAVNQQ